MLEQLKAEIIESASISSEPKLVHSKGNKGGKISRNKRKNGRKGSPISQFVRGNISGEDYFRQTGQASKR